MSELLDLADAARLLGVDFEGVRRLIAAGELPAVPHRYGVTVPKDAALAYLRAKGESPDMTNHIGAAIGIENAQPEPDLSQLEPDPGLLTEDQIGHVESPALNREGQVTQ